MYYVYELVVIKTYLLTYPVYVTPVLLTPPLCVSGVAVLSGVV